MSYRRPPRPTREDVTAEKIVRECAARGHTFPESEPLRPTETTTGPDGRMVNRQRTPCRECGTLQVQTWNEPENTSTNTAFLVMVGYEAPEPGDVPRLAEHAARVTDEEFAAALARKGHRDAPPVPAPRDTARPETLDLAVRVHARQFYLLDAEETLADILPIPEDATSVGIADAVPGTAVLWTGLQQGTVHLTVVVSHTDPGAVLDGYEDVVELTYRSTTGHVAIKELGGTAHPLPPLSAGHGDHRLRFHVRDADTADTADRTGTPDDPAHQCLLQIWRAPRTRPVIVKATSDWASSRVRLTAPGAEPGRPPSRGFMHG